ncbi:conserved hypothetical protein [Theileria equi strain WA]|uniref:Ubiquitin-like domain-containing protein n=1 Tax=Theileria equi strain WA TaxID=1537102 RepID=L1LFK9_THEEQ|nr:conserved hypothetical protein [Theileria equi strain WA]EKX74141.1 conserved hypothetical protein [Theileria equi strain WA]|eukprot:XP_004833593.1 conserved hypothetical protein [Theileria equi strain WA]
MEHLNVKLLINHYDCESKVVVEEFPKNSTIALIKEKLLEKETIKECTIRIIYRGMLLRDGKVLEELPGFSTNETLILTVFITKPTRVHTETIVTERNDIWKWSTFSWIAIIATLWCYKFKFNDSFKNFSVLVLYLATIMCIHTVFARFVNYGRDTSSAVGTNL